jgi:hypothetical protein
LPCYKLLLENKKVDYAYFCAVISQSEFTRE